MNVAPQHTSIFTERPGDRHCLIFRLAAVALVAIAFLLIATPHTAAQGCAMCYQNAASSGAHGRAALRHGILILLLPALSVFFAIFLIIYRRSELR